MPDVLQELLSCDVVFRPGHQVSSCLGVSAVREFVSLPLAVCAVPGCPGQCLYEVGQDLAIRAHDAAVFCPYPVDAVGVAEGEDLPRGPGTPFVVCATAAESERSGAGAPPVLRRWRHHLPGKSAGGRDHDQRPVTGADREGSRVILLENAQDVGDLFAVTRAGPAPADHDPLADIGGCEADLEPVAHAGHLFPGWAARRRVPGPGPGAWIVAGLGAAAGSGGRLRFGDGGMMPL